ncbi:hypothetical protein BGZ80_002046 [Entomortierella chlamydospora]|uniref:Uncharacterized protein n=1 Tax=Entomortierella chlamydospora TaxID=101097 RepID=A0A9P6MQV6_9FUNG|nr:hypothetical protein BGZ79_002239 [Entomortierella chlamydospora]KAG0009797.1 hypothetical protein BGZ80_002046 [Entomortierella chlamydospora]
MSLLSRYLRQSLVSTRINATAPLAAVVPHWDRSFSSSSQSFRKDIIKDAPGWDAKKATESEADVKADRQRLPKDMKQLQEETIEITEEERVDVNGQTVKKVTEKVKVNISEDPEITEEIIEDLARHAQNAGTKLGKVTGTIKGKIEDLEETVEEDAAKFVDSIKNKIGHEKEK